LVYGAGQCIKTGPAFAITAKRGENGAHGGTHMALTMSDKQAARKDRNAWPAALQEEFAAEACHPNGCVGSELVSETGKVRVWTIRLSPGQRFGFHRHVLNYFWTAITPCRGRQHLMDGSTVEYTYAPGETRHESYGPGEFKVHDLENIGDGDMVFMTVEFLDSANVPLALPEGIRAAAA
jgi:beta-alanine degradation protein BauB